MDGKAQVVQVQCDNVLEIVPLGTSKGKGVKILLESLCASPDQVCNLVCILHRLNHICQSPS